MTRRQRWLAIVSILMLVGALGGCVEGDSRDDRGDGDVCFLFGEREPNATVFTAQVLEDLFVDDCVIVDGSVFDVADVDSYRVFIQENLTLVVTLDHSPLVDFDVQLFDADTGQLILDCGVGIVPEACVVPFVVRSRDIAVDIVVSSVRGAGTYTLGLEAQ